ncbi:hypothetical protein PoB_000754900 [Plakobranchus ocellatus]|uniref:Uncharacterized protein n=1 Tax=Plakobranchus ocellatus TaxID=259542 RepID=A0AAV3YDD7_9GAST|nr:hypothetical protein PoB_000754900 [Plakobranchus ocellatus]
MAIHFSKPVRQLLKSIKRFQREHFLVPSNLSFERSQQHSPRMAAEVPLLPLPKGKKPRRIFRLPVPREQQGRKVQKTGAPRETVNRFAPLAMDAENTISSIWGDSSIPSSPRASASPMVCPPSPSKSRLPPPAEKLQGPPPSPLLPYPFTPEVQVTVGMKPTKKIKGLAGQPKGGLPSKK